MQQERVYEGLITSSLSKAFDTRKEMTAFTGQAARGVNMSEFVPLMADVDLKKGSLVKIVPFETADIDTMGEDGFKGVLFAASTEVGACGVR